MKNLKPACSALIKKLGLWDASSLLSVSPTALVVYIHNYGKSQKRVLESIERNLHKAQQAKSRIGEPRSKKTQKAAKAAKPAKKAKADAKAKVEIKAKPKSKPKAVKAKAKVATPIGASSSDAAEPTTPPTA